MKDALFDGELVYLSAPDPDEDAEIEARWTQDPDYLHLVGAEPAYPLTPAQIRQKYEASSKLGDREFWWRTTARPSSWNSLC